VAGKKGKSGRKKDPTNQMIAALDELRGDAPELIRQLKQHAFGESVVTCPQCNYELKVITKIDSNSAIYLLDRIYGKPKTYAEVEQKLTLTASEIRTLDEIGEQSRQNFIDGKIPEGLPELEEGKG